MAGTVRGTLETAVMTTTLVLATVATAWSTGTVAAIRADSAAGQARSTTDQTRLPVGDGKTVRTPTVGALWTCEQHFSGGGAHRQGPWMRDDGTFDLTAKAIVDGDVRWPHQLSITLTGTTRTVTGNGLPDHPTGIYPVARSDDAYQYDRNPNTITAETLQLSLPATPTLAAQPSCAPGAVGVLLSGSYLFNAVDAAGRDAVAHEAQDQCQGHPAPRGTYHYHSLSLCLDSGDAAGHSPLMGYAFDGFGIYGFRGEDGAELTNDNLDACHGHTHTVEWDGQPVELFHYHATQEFPYTVGCFRGRAAQVRPGGNGTGAGPSGAGAPGGPPPGGPGQPRPDGGMRPPPPPR